MLAWSEGDDMPLIRVGSRVGVGRLGAVYEGVKRGGARVAVKWVKPENLPTLRHDWEVLRELDHPHIVRTHGFSAEDSGGTMILDLAVGSLDALVMDSRTLVRVVRQVTEALHYLHGRGWVHRDLKPKNILLVGRDAVLSDFGLSLALPAEGPVAPCGTPAYMAPEAFLWQVGPALDWFALGVSLYEMLTEQLPFDGDSLQGDILAKQHGRYEPLAGHGQALWEPLVRGLLQPDTRKRWSSAEVLAFLEQVEEGWSFSRRASA